MSKFDRFIRAAFLSTSLLLTCSYLGCAGRLRIYDEYHGDWHRWDRDEDLAYRQYWDQRHEPYRDYHRLNKYEQKDYWNWRHEH